MDVVVVNVVADPAVAGCCERQRFQPVSVMDEVAAFEARLERVAYRRLESNYYGRAVIRPGARGRRKGAHL